MAGAVVALAIFSIIVYRSYSAHLLAQTFITALTTADATTVERLCDPKSLKIEMTQSGKLLMTLWPNSEREFRYSREDNAIDPWAAAGAYSPRYNSVSDFLTGRVTLGRKGAILAGGLAIRGGQVVYYEFE